MKIRNFVLRGTLFAAMMNFCSSYAQRQDIDIRDWQFSRDQQTWDSVRVPHDWAIAGPFDKKWDMQRVAIVQNGEKEATEKTGRSGALPWIGQGYYRTTVFVPKGWGNAMLHFDGAMSEPQVRINGKFAGEWKYGYNAFQIDVTSLLKAGRENTIEVALNNVEESSRWYPGGGIYRPVTLTLAPQCRIEPWGTYITTTDINPQGTATIAISNHIQGGEHHQKALRYFLKDAAGQTVAQAEGSVDNNGNANAGILLQAAHLWSPETPYLYTLTTELVMDGQVIDRTTNRVGVRTVRVDGSGFLLNGQKRKFQGVCLHHDLGPLGAAVNRAALIRQVRILKDMGCDAIRTSHNMPSTMQMEVCDSMGMMVMAESYDMWLYPKCKNGYARFFRDWADRDMTNLLLNHRNHPSIVMWSIGNEIPEQGGVDGRQISRHLQDICHQLDPYRPVTQGMDRAEAALGSGFAQVMDVAGFNYRVHKYDTNIKQLAQGVLLGSETASTVSSRGVYDITNWKPRVARSVATGGGSLEGQCSSYDTDFCSWSNLPEADFLIQEDRDWTMGQFVWTGFDYLGEPTPYDEYWPSRSSYFGICDLAGLPKDRYYLYRSVWNRDDHTLHILPHWNWQEGQTVPVFVYTDYPEAELFVNGKSMGRQKKQPYTVEPADANREKARFETPELLRRYRLIWPDVQYHSGTVRVVAYDHEGKPRMEKTLRTAGKPARLALTVDRNQIHADGDDLTFVTIDMTDSRGTLCPDADNSISISVNGAGQLRGLCNGDATSVESFAGSSMKLFHGRLVAVVQSNGKPGNITVTATSGKIKSSVTVKAIR